MKKYCALWVLLMGAGFGVSAQTFNGSDPVGQRVIAAKCRTAHVSLVAGRRRADLPDLFNHIRVVDLRRDTSRIGIVSDGEELQDQLVFRKPGGVVRNFGELLDSDYVTPKGNHSLLVAVKECWISDEPDSMGTRRSMLALRLEAYLENGDGYTPLVYLDTLIVAHLASMGERLIPALTDVFMDRVAGVDVDRPRTRIVSMAQIDSFAGMRYHYPMDTATVLVKGVYASVQEFRDNRPSATDFEIRKEGRGILDLQVRDADGKYYFNHTAWGLCDGKQVYVMLDGNIFPVFSVGHQFYVLGSKGLTQGPDGSKLPGYLPLGIGLAAAVVGSNINVGAYRDLRVLRLNAETGVVVK